MTKEQRKYPSHTPEISYELPTNEDKITAFSAKVVEEIMAYLDKVKTNPNAAQSVGSFWVEMPGREESLINLASAKQQILYNLTHAARLCGVRLVGPNITSVNPIDDAELAQKMIPILQKKLSPRLKSTLAETLPEIEDFLKKLLNINLTEQAELEENIVASQKKSFFTSLRRMLRPIPSSPEIIDTAVLPTVGIEVVYGKKSLNRHLYRIQTFPLSQLNEKIAGSSL